MQIQVRRNRKISFVQTPRKLPADMIARSFHVLGRIRHNETFAAIDQFGKPGQFIVFQLVSCPFAKSQPDRASANKPILRKGPDPLHRFGKNLFFGRLRLNFLLRRLWTGEGSLLLLQRLQTIEGIVPQRRFFGNDVLNFLLLHDGRLFARC